MGDGGTKASGQRNATLARVTTSDVHYLARQPIFDKKMRVIGYELLQRSAPGESRDLDDEQMTLAVTAKALIGFGFDRLVGNALAFVNTPAGYLDADIYRVLPADRTVLEVLERVEVTPSVVKNLLRARDDGYQLALDDFQGGTAQEQLLGLVDIVKVDLMGLNPARLRAVFAMLKKKAPQARLLAEKVETAAELTLVKSLGAELFQGFFFATPTVMTASKVPADAMVLLELAGSLDGDDLDLQRVARVLSHEPRMTFRLLQLVNSASVGLAQRIDSVERATAMLGADQLRRLVLLLMMTTAGQGPDEVVNLAVVRAKMAETLAPVYNVNPATAFTTGMLSMSDVAFASPMETLVEQLPLSDAIREALVHRTGDLGRLLDDVVAYERGTIALEPTQRRMFVTAYASALAAANELRQAIATPGT